MENCLLLSARRYQFADDKTGRAVEGVSLTYVTADVEHEPDRLGMAPLTISAPFELWPSLGALPGVYQLDLKQRPGKNGRPTLTCVGARFVSPVDLARGLASASAIPPRSSEQA
jgi:hypothetical protein